MLCHTTVSQEGLSHVQQLHMTLEIAPAHSSYIVALVLYSTLCTPPLSC